MIEARTSTPSATNDLLNRLLYQIAAHDRAAFRRMYAFLVMRVWRDAVRAMPHAADARAVTRSTFVEVWHLAGHHRHHARADILIWVAAITARQVDDRIRRPDPPWPMLADADRHVQNELAALLGAGHATVRTGPTAFARIDLQRDLS